MTEQVSKPSAGLHLEMQTKPKIRKTNEEKEQEALLQIVKKVQEESHKSLNV